MNPEFKSGNHQQFFDFINYPILNPFTYFVAVNHQESSPFHGDFELSLCSGLNSFGPNENEEIKTKDQLRSKVAGVKMKWKREASSVKSKFEV